ncbi:hypothetical protein ACSSV8_002829 [Roseovarius sp. MBR-79]|jgi:hypothetical protein
MTRTLRHWIGPGLAPANGAGVMGGAGVSAQAARSVSPAGGLS